MTTQELLQAMESQTHAQRIQAMVALGRHQDADSVAIIADLERGGFYERQLALYSCFGGRDSAHVLRALNDPSRLLRGLASRLVAIVCDDTNAIRALDEAPMGLRVQVAKTLGTRRRSAVVDAYITRPETDASATRSLLPFASPEVAAQLASTFAESATNDDWRRLARFRPALTLTLLAQRIAATSEPDGRLIARVNLLLPLLARAEPDGALALVTSLRRLAPLGDIQFACLSDPRPAAVADLLLSEPQLAMSRFRARNLRAGVLSTQQIVALYRLNQSMFGWDGKWFQRLTGPRRTAVFAGIRPLLQHHGMISTQFIAALPTEERTHEARRVLQAPTLPLASRLPYAAFLPWDEAVAALDSSLHATEAPLRQVALSALIGVMTYHHDRLDDTLERVRERRSEQDALRRAAITALRELPAQIWQPRHLPALAEILRHGLDDVGLSSATLQQMCGLLVKLLPYHTDWCSAQLAEILRERGGAANAIMQVGVTSEAQMLLAQALTPMFELWAARDDEAAIVSCVDRLFRRPAVFALAADALEALLRRTRNRHQASQALALFKLRAPERFDQIASALLAKDASWITFAPISEHLLRRRQDLVGPYLTARLYGGRWETGQQPFLPPLPTRFVGGTASQQEQYASAVMAIASDGSRESREAIEAVKSLALLPAIPAARLVTLANDQRPVVRTTALFALGRLDTAAGLPTLLDALEDSRARIAIHALRRSLKSMPESQALNILGAVSLDRVTVAKEVVRLIGELPSEEAYAALLEFARRDLHRDVRIALLHALSGRLDHEQTWDVLEQAARSPDRELALAPLDLTTLRSGHLLALQENLATQRHILRLIATLIEHPDPQARMDALSFCALLGIPDDERALTPILANRVRDIITAAHSRAEYDEALATAKALFGVCAANDEAVVAQTLTALSPHRRILQAAWLSLKNAPRARQRGLLPVFRAAIATLERDPLTVELRIMMAVSRLPASELGAFLTALASGDALHAAALMRACKWLADVRNRSDAEAFEALEPRLSRSRNERVRRLALAILDSRAGSAGGWDAALLERLRVYRADPSPLVASAAQFIFPDDDDPGA